jgi:hypothetical protein
MPILPILHSVSDAELVARYRAARARDPALLGERMADIKRSLTITQIRRGGGDSLTKGDYNVELTSWEDAAKVEG